MNNKYISALAIALALGGTGMSAQAATFQPGDYLTINSGVASYDGNGNQVNVSGGSWFALDGNLNNQIVGTEKTAISAIPGGSIPLGGQVMAQVITPIDAWSLYSNPGYDYLTANVTGDTTTGLDFSGWTINYNGAPVTAAIDYGAWTPTNCGTLGCTGVSFAADTAAISWNGVYGSSYSLWYSWRFQDAAPGAMVYTSYLLHLTGTVQSAVPVPAAAWLFGSGLLGLLGLSQRSRV